MVVPKLEFDLPEAQPVPRTSRNGDLVVVELGDVRVLFVAQREALSNGLEFDQLTQGLPSEHAAQDALGLLRHVPAVSHPGELVAHQGVT